MKKYLFLILLFASCKTYTGVLIDQCGGYVQYTTHKSMPQPTYEKYGDMWLIRWKDNSALVFDTAGQLEKLKKPVPAWVLNKCK